MREYLGKGYDPASQADRQTATGLAKELAKRYVPPKKGITFDSGDWYLTEDGLALYPASRDPPERHGDAARWSHVSDAIFGIVLTTSVPATIALRTDGTDLLLARAVSAGVVHKFPNITKDRPLLLTSVSWWGCHFVATAPIVAYRAEGLRWL